MNITYNLPLYIGSVNQLKIDQLHEIDDPETFVNDAEIWASLFYAQAVGVTAGEAVDDNDGVFIPVESTGRFQKDDYVRLEGTKNYNGEYTVSRVDDTGIIIDADFAEETFDGKERIYIALPEASEVALPYVESSDGQYKGSMPANVPLRFGDVYYLYFTIMREDTLKATDRLQCTGVYYPQEVDM